MRQLGKGNYLVGMLVMALFAGSAGYFGHRGWSELKLKRQLRTEGVGGQATVLGTTTRSEVGRRSNRHVYTVRYSFRVPSPEQTPGTEEDRDITNEVRVSSDVYRSVWEGALIPILYLPGHPEANLPVAMTESGTSLFALLFGGGIALLCGFVMAMMTIKLVRGGYGASSFFVTGRP